MTNKIRFTEISSTQGKYIGVATLNDEKSLNALSLEMIDALQTQLTVWENNSDIACVFLQGTGEKAFCAGGDIRELYESMVKCGEQHNAYAVDFFKREYELDYHIHCYSKPIVVWATGVVMGGGMGICNGASHRIVTETTRMAMPETAIGLYPDVGGTYFLNKMPEGVGLFLGLTGVSLNAGDAISLDLADHMVSSAQREDVLESISHIQWNNESKDYVEQITSALSAFESTPPRSHIEQHRATITHFMSQDSLSAIYDAIVAYDGDNKWLQSAAKAIRYACPTSLHLVCEQLKRGKSLSLAQAFQQEFVLSSHVAHLGNFQEGIRALLIDKDRAPKFKPATLAEVSDAFIQQHFTAYQNEVSEPLANLST